MSGKLIFGGMCYGREPFFKSMLKNIYQYADKIVLVEGYVKENWGESDSKYIAECVSEIDTKMKIHYVNAGKISGGSSVGDKNLLAQMVLNESIKHMEEGDWFIKADSDEFWTSETIAFIKDQPDYIIWLAFPTDNFYGDFFHIYYVDPKAFNRPDVPKVFDRHGNFLVNGMYEERVYRYFKGYNINTNFTTVKDYQSCAIYADVHYQNNRIFIPREPLKFLEDGKRKVVNMSDVQEVAIKNQLKYSHYVAVGSTSFILKKIYYHHHRRFMNSTFESFLEDMESGESGRGDSKRYDWTIKSQMRMGSHHYIFKVKDYVHPFPISKHPFFGKAKDEILGMEIL